MRGTNAQLLCPSAAETYTNGVLYDVNSDPGPESRLCSERLCDGLSNSAGPQRDLAVCQGWGLQL